MFLAPSAFLGIVSVYYDVNITRLLRFHIKWDSFQNDFFIHCFLNKPVLSLNFGIRQTYLKYLATSVILFSEANGPKRPTFNPELGNAS